MSSRQIYLAVYVAILKGDAVLMLKRASGYGSGSYSLIAGHVEEGESSTSAAIRETFEESGLEIKAEDISHFLTLHRRGEDGKVYIDLFFSVSRWVGIVENREPDKCYELKWCSLQQLPNPTLAFVREALEGLRSSVRRDCFLELGW